MALITNIMMKNFLFSWRMYDVIFLLQAFEFLT